MIQVLLSTEALVPPLTGIGWYTYQLLKKYRGQLGEDSLHCYAEGRLLNSQEGARPVEFSDKEASPAGSRVLKGCLNMVNETLPPSAHQWISRRGFRKATRHLSTTTVYHEPNYILKPFPGPAVVTIHDLSIYHYPEFHPASRLKYMERYLPKTIENADHVITDSALVKKELIKWFGLDEGRVSAVHLGVSEEFRPVEEKARRAVLSRYGLDDDAYLFCAATFEPRKNLSGLVAAFSSLPTKTRKAFPLVLAGSAGWLSKDLGKEVESLAERREVVRLGYVPREHLPAIYSGARLFVFPSFYEGFGLPVLEAMACGTPVVTSLGTAMEEITLDAAHLITPGDDDALSEAMSGLIDDNGSRNRLSGAGRRRASIFTWDRCAEESIGILKSITPKG